MKINISQIIHNLKRKKIINGTIGKFGKIVEEEDKIICYVEKRKLKKDKYSYLINCHGAIDKKLAEQYNLNKKICYVFDGIEFNHMVYLFGYDGVEIIVRNCVFEYDARVKIFGDLTLEKTLICALEQLTIDANNLTLQNMNIKNNFALTGNKLHIFLIGLQSLNIINSKIGNINNSTNTTLNSNIINLVNSTIAGSTVKCEANKINTNNDSSIYADVLVDLNDTKFDKLNLTSPSISYKNKTYKSKGKILMSDNLKEPLLSKRLELVNLLRELKANCQNIYSEKIEEYHNLLNNKPISKVLEK